MDDGASVVTILSFVSNAHRKATLFAPVICPLENYAEWAARSFYEEASRTLFHPRRSGRAIQGWGHGIARVGHAP
jgi:hypothetical protein